MRPLNLKTELYNVWYSATFLMEQDQAYSLQVAPFYVRFVLLAPPARRDP